METSYISRTSGIGTRDKIGYAMGDLASLLVFGLVQSVLQKYYTDVLGIGVVSIMVMFIIARVWDAINDPLWGRIIDRIPPAPDGRYRRWLKTLALPVALSAVLMFVKIPGLSEGGYLAYAYVTYILFGMLYTGINIPYGSLAQVITSDDRERSSLSVFRSIGSTFGAMPAMLLISFCYVKNANGTSVMSYSKILTGAAIIAALSVAAYLLCYRWTTERVPTKPAPKEKGQTWKVIKILLHSQPYMAVCLVGMLFLAAQMFSQSYNTYLFNYYFNAPSLSMMPTVCQYLPVAVIMLFAGKLGARFGRREVCAYGMLMAGDLVVGSVAAMETYGAPVIVLDMGTATTIVAIDRSRAYIGGAIIPGVNLSYGALAAGTSLLPSISITAPKKVIATNTVDSMRSGAVYGTAAMLDGMIERMEAELGGKCTVVATGGLASSIIPYCRREIICDDDLLLKGLWILYKKNK